MYACSTEADTHAVHTASTGNRPLFHLTREADGPRTQQNETALSRLPNSSSTTTAYYSRVQNECVCMQCSILHRPVARFAFIHSSFGRRDTTHYKTLLVLFCCLFGFPSTRPAPPKAHNRTHPISHTARVRRHTTSRKHHTYRACLFMTTAV